MSDEEPVDWGPPQKRSDAWPDDPEIRKVVEWMRGFLSESDWNARRTAHVRRLHGLHFDSTRPPENTLPEVFVANEDVGGWYLLLAEAYIDHIADYEPAQGSRVIPIFKALGRDFDLLMSVEGVAHRARRILFEDRKQPDGILFELLVALAYRREGWPIVRFIDENKGGNKTPDIQIFLDPSNIWSIECKRLGRSQYARNERDQFWHLWSAAMPKLERDALSVFFDLNFRVELSKVPNGYLEYLLERFVASGREFVVDDDFCVGIVRQLDLEPIQRVLSTDNILAPSQRLFELLVGEYDRFASYASAMKFKPWSENRRYIETLDVASVARWRCSATESIDAKARHFFKQLAEANEQLAGFGPSIVHIAFEAMDGDEIEVVRRPKVLRALNTFDPRGTDLRWIFLTYFVHESPPDQSWAIEETTEWFSLKRPSGKKPLNRHLVLPPDADTAPHPWQR